MSISDLDKDQQKHNGQLSPEHNSETPHTTQTSTVVSDAVITSDHKPAASNSNDTVPQDTVSQESARPSTVPIGLQLPARESRSNAQTLGARRRARINRIMMYRRHQRRGKQQLALHFAMSAAILLVATSILLSSGASAVYAYYQEQMPLLDGLAQHSLFQTTHIYDRNGKLLYELYDQQQGKGRRTYVNYEDISPWLVKATVAAEDHSFWNNDGVDLSGIARATLSNLHNHGIVEGGSTITQQLIKNQLFLGQERNFQLKGEEALLAIGLAKKYAKEERFKIMEMYLNTVYYGNVNYGAEAAIEDYFGLMPQCTNKVCKPAIARLDLAQATLLAGLPQSPSLYNPISNKQAALARQNDVLQAMLSLGMITQEQALQAHQEIESTQFKSHTSNHMMQAPHFVHYLIDKILVPLLGAQNLADGGYSIYTTLDLELEHNVEQIVYNHLYKPQEDSYLGYYGPLNISNNVNNGAAVVMNPANGEILAMDGSAQYSGMNTAQMQGEDNAALALRQPGSSFKPIVYATAFEMGWYPAMIIPDHKTVYPRKTNSGYYSPQNYDGKFHTDYPMTVRTAVANSFNIPAIDAIMFTGLSNVQNMAGRLGLSEVANLPEAQIGPSMAIGSKEVSLLHMTGAYATFANRGLRASPTSILEIRDNKGQVIYKYNEHPQGVRAVGEDVAYLISSILSDKTARYREFFPGNPLELDRPAAAKTGTTDSFRDNWTVGYTPHLAVGVWAGNSDNTIMYNVIGITGAGPIWHDIMQYASQRYNLPPDNFVQPDNVHRGSVSANTGLLPNFNEPTVSDWFIDGTMPTIHGSSNRNSPEQCILFWCWTRCQDNNCNE